MDETLENIKVEETPQVVPQVVKTLAILAYIGNAFWGIAIVGVLMWAMSGAASFEKLMRMQVIDTGALLVGGLVAVIICIVPIIGAVFMAKGRKLGFWLYVSANGLWVLLNFASGVPQNIVVGAISLGFIIGFATQLKNLR